MMRLCLLAFLLALLAVVSAQYCGQFGTSKVLCGTTVEGQERGNCSCSFDCNCMSSFDHSGQYPGSCLSSIHAECQSVPTIAGTSLKDVNVLGFQPVPESLRLARGGKDLRLAFRTEAALGRNSFDISWVSNLLSPDRAACAAHSMSNYLCGRTQTAGLGCSALTSSATCEDNVNCVWRHSTCQSAYSFAKYTVTNTSSISYKCTGPNDVLKINPLYTDTTTSTQKNSAVPPGGAFTCNAGTTRLGDPSNRIFCTSSTACPLSAKSGAPHGRWNWVCPEKPACPPPSLPGFANPWTLDRSDDFTFYTCPAGGMALNPAVYTPPLGDACTGPLACAANDGSNCPIGWYCKSDDGELPFCPPKSTPWRTTTARRAAAAAAASSSSASAKQTATNWWCKGIKTLARPEDMQAPSQAGIVHSTYTCRGDSSLPEIRCPGGSSTACPVFVDADGVEHPFTCPNVGVEGKGPQCPPPGVTMDQLSTSQTVPEALDLALDNARGDFYFPGVDGTGISGASTPTCDSLCPAGCPFTSLGTDKGPLYVSGDADWPVATNGPFTFTLGGATSETSTATINTATSIVVKVGADNKVISAANSGSPNDIICTGGEFVATASQRSLILRQCKSTTGATSGGFCDPLVFRTRNWAIMSGTYLIKAPAADTTAALGLGTSPLPRGTTCTNSFTAATSSAQVQICGDACALACDATLQTTLPDGGTATCPTGMDAVLSASSQQASSGDLDLVTVDFHRLSDNVNVLSTSIDAAGSLSAPSPSTTEYTSVVVNTMPTEVTFSGTGSCSLPSYQYVRANGDGTLPARSHAAGLPGGQQAAKRHQQAQVSDALRHQQQQQQQPQQARKAGGHAAREFDPKVYTCGRSTADLAVHDDAGTFLYFPPPSYEAPTSTVTSVAGGSYYYPCARGNILCIGATADGWGKPGDNPSNDACPPTILSGGALEQDVTCFDEISASVPWTNLIRDCCYRDVVPCDNLSGGATTCARYRCHATISAVDTLPGSGAISRRQGSHQHKRAIIQRPVSQQVPLEVQYPIAFTDQPATITVQATDLYEYFVTRVFYDDVNRQFVVQLETSTATPFTLDDPQTTVTDATGAGVLTLPNTLPQGTPNTVSPAGSYHLGHTNTFGSVAKASPPGRVHYTFRRSEGRDCPASSTPAPALCLHTLTIFFDSPPGGWEVQACSTGHGTVADPTLPWAITWSQNFLCRDNLVAPSVQTPCAGISVQPPPAEFGVEVNNVDFCGEVFQAKFTTAASIHDILTAQRVQGSLIQGQEYVFRITVRSPDDQLDASTFLASSNFTKVTLNGDITATGPSYELVLFDRAAVPAIPAIYTNLIRDMKATPATEVTSSGISRSLLYLEFTFRVHSSLFFVSAEGSLGKRTSSSQPAPKSLREVAPGVFMPHAGNSYSNNNNPNNNHRAATSSVFAGMSVGEALVVGLCVLICVSAIGLTVVLAGKITHDPKHHPRHYEQAAGQEVVMTEA